MNASPADQAAVRQAFVRINTALHSAEAAVDAETIKRRLFALSLAVIDAEALIRAVEENTRNAAQRELEVSLEQRVGMELERL